MPSGLYLYDTAGNIQYSSSTRLLKFVDSRLIYLSHNQFVDVYISGMTTLDEWVVQGTPLSNSGGWAPEVIGFSVVKYSGYYRFTNTRGASGTTTFQCDVYRY